MNEQELLYTIALTRLGALSSSALNYLLDTMGSATAVYEQRHDIRQALPAASQNCREAIASMGDHLQRAEQELAFAHKGQIQCISRLSSQYPTRLLQCDDAPALLYYRGSASLNNAHIISIVGTRQCTEYGKDLCRQFTAELHQLLPDALVVSGLAYGIDINAHRQALQNGLPTVGVLAHGLDQIYPQAHRDTAIQMLQQGGLLTEYPSGTAIDKRNFVARNRIVAGMADATIVVESASKGGSLITAGMACDYGRSVFAFPGRLRDQYSAGCNKIIRSQQATLITSAQDLLDDMGWQSQQSQQAQRQESIQRQLFVELSAEEQLIVQALQNSDGKHLDTIAAETQLPAGHLSGLLFNLEMKGIVKMMVGNQYRLL